MAKASILSRITGKFAKEVAEEGGESLAKRAERLRASKAELDAINSASRKVAHNTTAKTATEATIETSNDILDATIRKGMNGPIRDGYVPPKNIDPKRIEPRTFENLAHASSNIENPSDDILFKTVNNTDKVKINANGPIKDNIDIGKRYKDAIKKGRIENEAIKKIKMENEAISPDRLNKNKYKSKDGFARLKQHNAYEDAMKSYKNKDFDNPLLKSIAEQNNINPKDLKSSHITSARAHAIKSASGDDLGLRDLAGYYKVPQKAVGVAGTAWLVSRLSSSGGQQTNSQLYGQSPV